MSAFNVDNNIQKILQMKVINDRDYNEEVEYEESVEKMERKTERGDEELSNNSEDILSSRKFGEEVKDEMNMESDVAESEDEEVEARNISTQMVVVTPVMQEKVEIRSVGWQKVPISKKN